MAEFDFITILIPVILSAIVSFVLLGVNKLGKTSDYTLSGTIKLEHVAIGLEELKEELNKKFERLEESRSGIYDRLNKIETDLKLDTYRIEKLERNENGRGGNRSAI